MNKPTFPRPFSGKEVTSPSQDGMSLLEYYAGQVAPMMFNRLVAANEQNEPEAKFAPDVVNEGVARFAFIFAEAMIKEAEKRTKP